MEGCRSGLTGGPGKTVYLISTVGSNPTPSARIIINLNTYEKEKVYAFSIA